MHIVYVCVSVYMYVYLLHRGQRMYNLWDDSEIYIYIAGTTC